MKTLDHVIISLNSIAQDKMLLDDFRFVLLLKFGAWLRQCLVSHGQSHSINNMAPWQYSPFVYRANPSHLLL